MSKNAEKTYFVALGGMIAALSMVLMFISSLTPVMKLVLPAMAGILLICAVCEMGEGWASLIFAVVSLLSLLLPTKAVAIFYILFFGHYPILKSFIERIKYQPLKWAVKLVIFNICAAAALYIVITFFGFPKTMLKFGYLPLALVLSVAFVVYDVALSGIVVLYGSRISKIIHRH